MAAHPEACPEAGRRTGGREAGLRAEDSGASPSPTCLRVADVRASRAGPRAGALGVLGFHPRLGVNTDSTDFEFALHDVGDRLSAADGERDRTPCSSACVGLAARTQRAPTAPTRISQLEQKPLLATHRP